MTANEGDPGFTHWVPQADALVFAGDSHTRLALPAVEKVIGGTPRPPRRPGRGGQISKSRPGRCSVPATRRRPPGSSDDCTDRPRRMRLELASFQVNDVVLSPQKRDLGERPSTST